MKLVGEAAMLAFGGALAQHVRPSDVIALAGALGAGKTTLARGILAGLGLKGEAPSPTFALVQPYAPPETRIPVCHVDLYRIEDRSEMMELGLEDARCDHLLLIEWPERLGEDLWPDSLVLRIDGAGMAERRLTAQLPKAWKDRWPF